MSVWEGGGEMGGGGLVDYQNQVFSLACALLFHLFEMNLTTQGLAQLSWCSDTPHPDFQPPTPTPQPPRYKYTLQTSTPVCTMHSGKTLTARRPYCSCLFRRFQWSWRLSHRIMIQLLQEMFRCHRTPPFLKLDQDQIQHSGPRPWPQSLNLSVLQLQKL